MNRRHLLLLSLLVFASDIGCQTPRAVRSPTLTKENGATRFVRFQVGPTVAYGIVEGDRIESITGDPFGPWQKTGKAHALAEVQMLAPTVPTKVLAAAGNYRSHRGDTEEPANPEFFFMAPSSVIATGGNIVLPPGTNNVHYEAEFVIVIGKRAKNVPEDKALDYIVGITCGNDVSARDWQKKDVQWWRAKASDTFAPCGPYIISGVNYDNLVMRLRQNGVEKQEQRVKGMIHGPAALVSFVSKHMTLEPGDLIFAGTSGETQQIHPGDVIEVEIDGMNILKNGVQAAR